MPTQKFLKAAKDIQERHVRRKEEAQPHSDAHDESNWLVSYADMMTLLCGFFIMLFSMAKLDDTKYEKVKEELSKQFGGTYEKPATSELASFLTQIIQEMGIEKQAVVQSDIGGVSVAFQSTVFFDTLSADVRPQGKDVLERLIDGIRKRPSSKDPKGHRIVVEGHTDSRPVTAGTFPSNWELSGARAARVIRMFLEKGFDPDKLTAIAYADTRPVAPSRSPAGEWDEEALSRNRRVVVRILEPQVEAIPFAENSAH